MTSLAAHSPRVGPIDRPGMRSLRSVLEIPSVRLSIMAVILAHSLDVLSTLMALAMGANEVNPLTASVLHVGGVSALLAEKAAVVLITVYNMLRLPRRWSVGLGAGATAITAFAVAANIIAMGNAGV